MKRQLNGSLNRQYSTELVGVALPLIAIFLSPGPGLSERKQAFESGAALFIPSVFSDRDEPEPTFENEFATFNPNPIPRDPELPGEQEEAEEVEMEVAIISDAGSDEQIAGEEAEEVDDVAAKEAVASDDEQEDDIEIENADEESENRSEGDGGGSDAEAEAGEKEEAEDKDGTNSDNSGTDSDSESDNSLINNALPQSAYDFLLAVRGAVLDPKADMEEWVGKIMRDIITYVQTCKCSSVSRKAYRSALQESYTCSR
jgi:hypothetical protein